MYDSGGSSAPETRLLTRNTSFQPVRLRILLRNSIGSGGQRFGYEALETNAEWWSPFTGLEPINHGDRGVAIEVRQAVWGGCCTLSKQWSLLRVL